MSTLFSHFFEKINTISPQEAHFTEVLASIALKPKMLYFYGKLPENVLKTEKSGEKAESRPKTVAIVGTRHSTKYGEEVAYNLAYDLAKRGAVIVSGLAFGIDSIAHKACLDAGGTTVAVLGTPIDRIYPSEHKPLAERILQQNGAILSEYAPRAKEYENMPLGYGEAGFKNGVWRNPETSDFVEDLPYETRRIDLKNSFLRRNRLISGLADVVIVVEAAEKSGSLNTAMHALAQNKDVFAVPGNINSPYSKGTNALIREGANPCLGSEDILRLLFPEDYVKKSKKSAAKTLVGDSEIETKVLRALASGLRSGDDIMEKTALSPDLFNQAVTLLEIKGRVLSLGANNWSLA